MLSCTKNLHKDNMVLYDVWFKLALIQESPHNIFFKKTAFSISYLVESAQHSLKLKLSFTQYARTPTYKRAWELIRYNEERGIPTRDGLNSQIQRMYDMGENSLLLRGVLVLLKFSCFPVAHQQTCRPRDKNYMILQWKVYVKWTSTFFLDKLTMCARHQNCNKTSTPLCKPLQFVSLFYIGLNMTNLTEVQRVDLKLQNTTRKIK